MPEFSCWGFVLSPSGGPLPINPPLAFLVSHSLVFVTQLPLANVEPGRTEPCWGLRADYGMER